MIFSEGVLHVSTWQALFPKESKIRIPWWRNEKTWKIMEDTNSRLVFWVSFWGVYIHDLEGFGNPQCIAWYSVRYAYVSAQSGSTRSTPVQICPQARRSSSVPSKRKMALPVFTSFTTKRWRQKEIWSGKSMPAPAMKLSKLSKSCLVEKDRFWKGWHKKSWMGGSFLIKSKMMWSFDLPWTSTSMDKNSNFNTNWQLSSFHQLHVFRLVI